MERARKLLGLYRGAVGGERDKARNLLVRLLDEHALTLADLEPGLPASRDPEALASWREADGWLARLGGPGEPEALSALVDAPGLTPPERLRVLDRLSVPTLADLRASGWLQDLGDPDVRPDHVVAAARGLDDELLASHAAPSLAESVKRLALERARGLARPERRLRAADRFQTAFLLALCEAVNGLVPRVEGADGAFEVVARLTGAEISRVRTLQNAHEGRLGQLLTRTARQFGLDVGREG